MGLKRDKKGLCLGRAVRPPGPPSRLSTATRMQKVLRVQGQGFRFSRVVGECAGEASRVELGAED